MNILQGRQAELLILTWAEDVSIVPRSSLDVNLKTLLSAQLVKAASLLPDD